MQRQQKALMSSGAAPNSIRDGISTCSCRKTAADNKYMTHADMLRKISMYQQEVAKLHIDMLQKISMNSQNTTKLHADILARIEIAQDGALDPADIDAGGVVAINAVDAAAMQKYKMNR